jgi:hypothetical protein
MISTDILEISSAIFVILSNILETRGVRGGVVDMRIEWW